MSLTAARLGPGMCWRASGLRYSSHVTFATTVIPAISATIALASISTDQVSELLDLSRGGSWEGGSKEGEGSTPYVQGHRQLSVVNVLGCSSNSAAVLLALDRAQRSPGRKFIVTLRDIKAPWGETLTVWRCRAVRHNEISPDPHSLADASTANLKTIQQPLRLLSKINESVVG